MDWTRGQTVGRGSTATVSIATAKESGQVFAVKSAELAQSEFLKREQRILSTLKCHQIVAYKGCDFTTENGTILYNLFMEYAPLGTVFDAIRKCNGGLQETIARTYARQILLGLQYLHSNGIVHCDIKGQNVLVTNEGVKIADLGCARRVDEVSNSDWLIAGTPVFMAPEVARGEQQGFPADVWALGCTVVEMVTGQAPWPDVSDPVSALYWIGLSGEVPEIPSFMSKQGRDFLSKCLKRDPKERWSVGELLKHGFVEETNLVMKEINGYNMYTPTSILDQGIWDSMEKLETIQNSTHTCSSYSPLDRLQQMFGGHPNWEWDDNWVTVRSNGIHELDSFSGSQDLNKPKFNANEHAETSGADTECVTHDNGLIVFDENTTTKTIGLSNSSTANIASNSSNSCGNYNYGNNKGKDFFVCCLCKQNVPNRTLDFEAKEFVLMNDLLLFSFLFLLIVSLSLTHQLQLQGLCWGAISPRFQFCCH